jgi:hypothetical protein
VSGPCGLSTGDTLVVTERRRLGRSTGEVISLINELVASDMQVVVIKQRQILDKQQNDMQAKIMTTLSSLFAELERDLISLRTREALAGPCDPIAHRSNCTFPRESGSYPHLIRSHFRPAALRCSPISVSFCRI